MKKLFIISDQHGFYIETIKALCEAGYNENDPSHLLVCLGDFTDRGPDCLLMYQYLYRLTKENKAIVLAGNHTKFFIDFLEGSVSPFNYLHNGLNETIADFWHRTNPFEFWCMMDEQCDMTQENYAKWTNICKDDINREYPELSPWLKSLPRYYETEKYIFVHASIDTNAEDWHKPHCFKHSLIDWDALDFDDGSFFGKEIKNTDKTIVIGHFGTCDLREMYGLDFDESPNEILTREDGRVIAIDATTVLSRKVNVLVLEDNLLEG